MRPYLLTIADRLLSASNSSQLYKFTSDRRRGCGNIFWTHFSDIYRSSPVSEMSRKEKIQTASLTSTKNLKVLNFAQYDFIGFDLDHTLARYNLRNLFTNHFNYLVKHLNTVKGYQIETELTPQIVDFISRGLVIDIERGNMLKMTFDGVIVRASHGTRAMDPSEIVKEYGSKRVWKPFKEVLAKKWTTWKIRSDEMYSFMDFTDAAMTAVYALAIDSGKPPKSVWADVLNAIKTMYTDERWANDIFNNASNYLYKTPKTVLKWVSQFRLLNIKTALITSNWYEFVPRIATNTLGSNWQSYFDFCVFNSRKPNFFVERSNFLDLNDKETEFKMSGNYTHGSIQIVIDALTKDLNREPKCVYVGDSPLHDFLFTGIDYVALVEELKAENLIGTGHPSAEFVSSRFWGSYLYEGEKPTVFGKIALDGQFCAPDLEYFSEKPNDYNFEMTLARPDMPSTSDEE